VRILARVTGNGSSHHRSAVFDQAVGMISVQADCTMDEAETKLRDRAALNATLKAGGIAPSSRMGATIVAPETAIGATLVFD